jgi:hypothetical protein
MALNPRVAAELPSCAPHSSGIIAPAQPSIHDGSSGTYLPVKELYSHGILSLLTKLTRSTPGSTKPAVDALSTCTSL